MKKSKSFIIILLVFLAFSTTNVATAEENTNVQTTQYQLDNVVTLSNEISDLTFEQIEDNSDKLTDEINELTNDDFDNLMHELTIKNSKDYQTLKEKLELVDVEYEPTFKKISEFAPLTIEANELTLTAYSTKRVGDSFWRINSSWSSSLSEGRPASYDLVSIEWDPDKASYYGYNVSSSTKNPTTARDGSKRGSGIYLFNSQDKAYIALDSYAVVYVTKKSGSKLDYGTKYTHSYAKTDVTISGEANFEFQKTGKVGGFTFNLLAKTKESKWTLWDDNTLSW